MGKSESIFVDPYYQGHSHWLGWSGFNWTTFFNVTPGLLGVTIFAQLIPVQGPMNTAHVGRSHVETYEIWLKTVQNSLLCVFLTKTFHFLISTSHKLHLRNVWLVRLVNSQKAEAYVVQGKGQER